MWLHHDKYRFNISIQDWTYVVQPSLEVYLMPYYTLIPQLRRALLEIKIKAEMLEEQWAQLKAKREALVVSSYDIVHSGIRIDNADMDLEPEFI